MRQSRICVVDDYTTRDIDVKIIITLAGGSRTGHIPQLDLPPTLPRNISEGQLMNFVGQVSVETKKAMTDRAIESFAMIFPEINSFFSCDKVSSRAINSVSSQLSRLNPMKRGPTTPKDQGCRGAFGGSSQAILMTVAEQAGEDRVSPEPATPSTQVSIRRQAHSSRSRTFFYDRGDCC